MTWLARILTFLLGFCSLWGVVFLVVTTYGWEKVWFSIHGPADMGAIEFGALPSPATRGHVLYCPELICSPQNQHQVSPVYDTDAETLRTALVKSLEQEKSLKRVDNNSDPLRLRYVQRSRLLRRPDTISLQFFNFDSGSASSLALYGQSQVQIPYFQDNMKRANRWLGRLKDLEKEPN